MGSPQIIFGTCDGTGAAINVCLGFIPRYVKVWNMEDAGTLLPTLEWTKQQSFVAAVDEGIKNTGISGMDFNRVVMTANGISAYNGGDQIRYDLDSSGRWELTTGTAFPGGNSAEEVYVDGQYEKVAATDAAYQCIGDVICPELYHGAIVTTTKGFTIGADADVNVDGEQLAWMVMR